MPPMTLAGMGRLRQIQRQNRNASAGIARSNSQLRLCPAGGRKKNSRMTARLTPMKARKAPKLISVAAFS